MIFPAPRGSASPGDLELDVIFEDHRVSWLTVDEMFALELVTYRRCFPAQSILSTLRRYSRRKCAHLLRDLAATADWPPHCALFSLQLLDLAHKWSEREDNDIHIFDVLPLAATVHVQITLNSAQNPDPDPFPDPQQPARPLADLLTAIAGILARCQPRNALSLHTAWTIQQIVTEEYRILDHQQRAWDIHAGSLDPSLQAAPLPAVSATTSAVSTPAPLTGSSRRACSWCTKYC